MSLPDFPQQLAELEAQTLLRHRRIVDSPSGDSVVVDGRKLINFCSNDYLGLANHPKLIAAAQEGAQRYGVGAGAAHLVCGHMTPHEALEQRLAAFVGMERALFFSTGYMANLGVVPALVGREDAVFSDRLNHASLIDAARLSRADVQRYRHLDLDELALRLSRSTARRKLIVTDGVFSMDGDIAPLPELLALCEQHDAMLLVDDAHGFGLQGPQGRGTAQHFSVQQSPRLIYMGTLGKAAGVSGAFVAGQAGMVEWLVQQARTYIFTTASPPLIAHTLLTSVDLIEADEIGGARREHLARLVTQLKNQLKFKRWKMLDSNTAIQPLIIGDNAEAIAVAHALRERGLWVVAIRPPTVPQGTARLRIALSAAHNEAQVTQLATTLLELEQQFQK